MFIARQHRDSTSIMQEHKLPFQIILLIILCKHKMYCIQINLSISQEPI